MTHLETINGGRKSSELSCLRQEKAFYLAIPYQNPTVEVIPESNKSSSTPFTNSAILTTKTALASHKSLRLLKSPQS